MLGEVGRGLHVYGFYFQYYFITRICHSNARKHFGGSKSEKYTFKKIVLFILPFRFERPHICKKKKKYTFYTISSYVIFVLLGKTFKISYQTGI